MAVGQARDKTGKFLGKGTAKSSVGIPHEGLVAEFLIRKYGKENVASQVYIQPYSDDGKLMDARIRIDYVVRDHATGETIYFDAKQTEKAVRYKQDRLFQSVSRNGGLVKSQKGMPDWLIERQGNKKKGKTLGPGRLIYIDETYAELRQLVQALRGTLFSSILQTPASRGTDSRGTSSRLTDSPEALRSTEKELEPTRRAPVTPDQGSTKSHARNTSSQVVRPKKPIGKGVGLIGTAQDILSFYKTVKDLIEHNRNIQKSKNLYPFLRRLVFFWARFDTMPYIEGVEDSAFSLKIMTNHSEIADSLKKDNLSALYIKHSPKDNMWALNDAALNTFESEAKRKVRNYNEYCSLFIDTGHGAVRHVSKTEFWDDAIWEIRVGHYDTKWENEVIERWIEVPRFTKIMQDIVQSVIANTNAILTLIGTGVPPSTFGSNFALGAMRFPGTPINRARLRSNATKVNAFRIPQGNIAHAIAEKDMKRNGSVLVQWSEPPFLYVYSIEDRHVTIGGADYNSYFPLRRVETRKYANDGLSADGRVSYSANWVPNEMATVLVNKTDIDILPL